MKFLWDEPKRRTNLKVHRYDLDQANDFDWERTVIRPAKDGRRGERRLMAVGQFQQTFVAIVFSLLGSEAISVISMRPASRAERRLYVREQESYDRDQ